jgi:hypothetical protein
MRLSSSAFSRAQAAPLQTALALAEPQAQESREWT